MRSRPYAGRETEDAAFLVQHYAPFGQVKLQPFPFAPRFRQQCPAGPQWLQCIVDQIDSISLKPAIAFTRLSRINGCLRLLIRYIGGDPDQGSGEAPRFHLSRLVDSEMASHCRTVLPRLQRPQPEEHTSELQSLMRISYDVSCLNKNYI